MHPGFAKRFPDLFFHGKGRKKQGRQEKNQDG